MASAARILDQTAHVGPPTGSISGPGVPNVVIEGRAAAVAGDMHSCTFQSSPPTVDPPSPMRGGSGTVKIGGRSAIRVGDSAGCGATVMAGATRTTIGG